MFSSLFIVQADVDNDGGAAKRELTLLQRRMDKYRLRLKHIEKLVEEPEAVASGFVF